MSDIKSPEERSRNMAAIKSKDTQPEVYLRKLLFSRGYRYRKNSPRITGHPDIWLAKYNTALFVHGCYWHRHPGCKFAYTPKSNVDFWLQKFQNNIQRDRKIINTLSEHGIKCLVIWECTIRKVQRDEDELSHFLSSIEHFLSEASLYQEL